MDGLPATLSEGIGRSRTDLHAALGRINSVLKEQDLRDTRIALLQQLPDWMALTKSRLGDLLIYDSLDISPLLSGRPVAVRSPATPGRHARTDLMYLLHL